MVYLHVEVNQQNLDKVKSWENYFASVIPVIPKPNGSKEVIDAMNKKLQYLPSILLISPDKEIIAETTMNTDLIDKALTDAGIAKIDPIFIEISDTINSTANLVGEGDWWFAHDTEGQGSKIVVEPEVTDNEMHSVIYIGEYVYPNIWTWGEVAMSLPSSVNLTNKEYITVTYRTNNNLVLTLPMEGTSDSYGPYGRTIPKSNNNEWITATYSMDQFGQPTWSELLDGLNVSKLESVAFITSYANDLDVTIDVKEIRFHEKGSNEILSKGISKKQQLLSATGKRLSFTIHNAGAYELLLISPLGKRMQSLPMQDFNPGHYTIDFSRSDLAQGFYIAQLRSKTDVVQSCKMRF